VTVLVGEQVADRLASGITQGVEPRIHLRQQGLVDDGERRADGNWHEHLLSHRFTARLDAAFIVALAGPTEAGFQQVVRRERGEPWRQNARAAEQDPHDGRAQIVVVLCARLL
jgi:hypothetical protein